MTNQKLRIYLNIFLLALIFVLLWLYFSPFGHISYQKDFSKKQNTFLGGKGTIYKLGPDDRLVDRNKIVGEPAYFYLKTNRSFDSAKVSIEYKISDHVFQDNDYINFEMGVLLNKDNWNYHLHPVYNNVLDSLYNSWHKTIEGDGTVFLQKEKKFSNFNDYLRQANFSSLLVYNYNLKNDFVLPDYQTIKNYKFLIPSLRGSHVFYAYLKDENLKFDFALRSLNQENEKKADIFVYLNQDIIFSKNFSVEELNRGNLFSLNLPGLPEGVYKIEIRSGDDIVLENFTSYMHKLVFLHKVNLYETKNGFDVFSNKADLRIKSLESKCLNKLNINEDVFEVNQIFKQFNFKSLNKGINNVKSNSCGMLIESNGLFSFSYESFFNPLISSLSSDVVMDDYNFILANYNSPSKKDDTHVSVLSFDLKEAYREKDEYRFIVSAPFLKGDDLDKYLEIKNIKIELQGKNLFEKVREYLNL
ncbi:MAG: hypothetical protein WC164_03620 [Patescibacteria group bacterium]|nr:hypothetical protein [Patescibacteria group bacterium]